MSAQSGDFTWSYPFTAPPAAAGPQPQVSLSYDSQSVDGETGGTNNQPSVVGDGWQLSGTGSISRAYVPCSQDDGSSGAVTSSGDLCWSTDNATISFAGHSGTLVKDATTGVWRLAGDDGTRIQHLVGAAQGCGGANGTYDDDCWRLTTTDGVQYYFGLNQLPGWASGDATTNSAWTVPVYGNDAGEPCHGATFAASACQQAWQWNLDYVVDPHGNAEALYYSTETNDYAQDGSGATGYVRAGQVSEIDYGLRAGSLFGSSAASDKLVFTYAARCETGVSGEPATACASTPPAASSDQYWPDVPWDLACSAAPCSGSSSPSFWSSRMLSSVTSEYLSGASYVAVDSWALGHSWPSPGDGTSPALWLTQVQRTGQAGSAGSAAIILPAETFTGAPIQNRVWVTDGLAPLEKYRVTSVTTETGAVISVNYSVSMSQNQCTPSNASSIEAAPQSNTNLCFPQLWTPQITPPQPAQTDLFYKYVVTSLVENPETGGGNDATEQTTYLYTSSPAWRFDTSAGTVDANRTWNAFAGYGSVEIRVGDPSSPSSQQTTDYTFFRGLNGDPDGTLANPTSAHRAVTLTSTTGTTVTDSLPYAGSVFQKIVRNGSSGGTAISTTPVVIDTVTTPWLSAATATSSYTYSLSSGSQTLTSVAYLSGAADVHTGEPTSTGAVRTTDVKTSYDSTYGLPLTVENDASDAPTTCSTTSYAPANTTAWLIDYPAEVDTVAATCSTVGSAVYPGAAISDVRTSYDGQAWNTAPTTGNATQTQQVDSYSGSTASTAHWVTASSSTFDALGRPLAVTDVLGHTTTTAYTPSTAGPLTSKSSTNTAPFHWTTSTAYDPAWGAVTSQTDVNGNITSVSYDALGRRIDVWAPDMPQGGNQGPTTTYTYLVSQSAANSVETTQAGATSPTSSYVLYDGLGRKIQTQAESPATGTVVSDTGYDAAGRVTLTNNPYWTTSVAPSGTLFVPASESDISSEVTTSYDGDGRVLSSTLSSTGSVRSTTTTAYLGADRVDVTPPAGGTPTSTYTNTRGHTTSLVQYLSATPGTGTAQAITYGYNAAGQRTVMTDPAGNTWSWAYDVLGHQIKAVDPDTGTTTSSYDDAGNLLTSTDAAGTTLAYSYDALNRKTALYSGSISGPLLDSWTYDSDTGALGQPVSATSYVGSTSATPGAAYTSTVNAYNDLYQPTSSTISIPTSAPAFGGTSYTTTSIYNNDGSLAYQTDPAEGPLAKERLSYVYGINDQLGTLAGTETYVAADAYTAIGQLQTYDRTGNTANSDGSGYSYDAATGRVINIQDIFGSGSNATTINDQSYSYDLAGDVTQINTAAPNLATDSQCFTYDPLRELTAAWTPSSGTCSSTPSSSTLGGPAPYWSSYTYDTTTGNRTSTTSHATTSSGTDTQATYSYPASGAGSVRPSAVSQISYATSPAGANTWTATSTPQTDTYTPDGQTTGRTGTTAGSQTLTYTAQGQLAADQVGTQTQSNIYDAAGDLLMQTDPVTGTTLYLGDTQLTLAPGASSASGVRTYTANGNPIAERLAPAGTGTSTVDWLLDNAQGTPLAEINTTTGAITRRYQDPFGNARGTTTPTWTSNHGFLNAPTTSLTGLTHLGARDYDPTLGRFLSVDPLLETGDPQAINGYAYADNNPVTQSDPSGAYILSPGGNYTLPGGSDPDPQASQLGGGCNSASCTTTAPPEVGGQGSGCETDDQCARHPAAPVVGNAPSLRFPTTPDGIVNYFNLQCGGNQSCVRQRLIRGCDILIGGPNEECDSYVILRDIASDINLRLYEQGGGGDYSGSDLGLGMGVVSTITGAAAAAAAATGVGAEIAVPLEGISLVTGAIGAGADCAHALDAQCGIDAAATLLAGAGAIGGRVVDKFGSLGEAGATVSRAAAESLTVVSREAGLSPGELLDLVFSVNATGVATVGSVYGVSTAVNGGNGG